MRGKPFVRAIRPMYARKGKETRARHEAERRRPGDRQVRTRKNLYRRRVPRMVGGKFKNARCGQAVNQENSGNCAQTDGNKKRSYIPHGIQQGQRRDTENKRDEADKTDNLEMEPVIFET